MVCSKITQRTSILNPSTTIKKKNAATSKHTQHIPNIPCRYVVIENAVASVLGQDYHSDRLTVWLYDDASDDTITIANACMSTGIVKSFDPPSDEDSSWANMAQAVKTMGFEQTQSGLLCIRSTRHLGPGE